MRILEDSFARARRRHSTTRELLCESINKGDSNGGDHVRKARNSDVQAGCEGGKRIIFINQCLPMVVLWIS